MVLRIYYSSFFKIPAVNNDYYIVSFMIYPDLNLVMNSIRILNDNKISLNFRLIYFMRGKAMANYPQELSQDVVCQSHTGHKTGLWFLPSPAFKTEY